MARLNILKLSHLGFTGAVLRTHEGALAVQIGEEAQLRRAVLACMLWEDQFYEDGVPIADRIAALVPRVDAAKVAALAIEARERMKLRHVPLLLVRVMRRSGSRGLSRQCLPVFVGSLVLRVRRCCWLTCQAVWMRVSRLVPRWCVWMLPLDWPYCCGRLPKR